MNFDVRYHGNWCGPGWSDGRYTESTKGFAPAIDEFDETCRQHDFALAGGRSDPIADHLFVKQNFGQGAKRTTAAVAVWSRDWLDRVTTEHKNYKKTVIDHFKGNMPARSNFPKTNKMSAKDRAANPVLARVKAQGSFAPSMQVARPIAPVSIGTQLKARTPRVVRSTTAANIVGTDFLATVEGQGVSTFGLGKSAVLSPAYFASTVLGNLARSFESYRFNRLRIHYVPKVATNITGQVILCSQKSVSEPGLTPEAGTFLNRAMSQGNAVFSPLWCPCSIDIDCPNEFKLVDPTTTVDPDDAIWEELQVYTQISASAQVGYLLAEYDISFKEPIYQPHAASLPIITGPGVRVVLTENAAANAANDDWLTADVNGVLSLATLQNGTILRGVFDLQGSVAATGTTFSNLLLTIVSYRTTTAVTATTATNMTFLGGTTFYFVVVGSTLQAYTSIEAALNGNGTGQVFIRTATTVAGTYNFDMTIIRQGVVNTAQIQ